MADKVVTNESIATNDTSPPKKEAAFTLERLAKGCRELFGVSHSTFVGATSKFDAGKDKKYSVEEIKKIIKDWGETPVFAKDRKALKGGK